MRHSTRKPIMKTSSKKSEPESKTLDQLGEEIFFSFLEKLSEEDKVAYHLYPKSSLQYQTSGDKKALKVQGKATLAYYTLDGRHCIRTSDTHLPIQISFSIDGRVKKNEYCTEEGIALEYDVSGLDWNQK